MALLSLEGLYEDGKVELKEHPPGVTRARVVVTFLPDADAAAKETARRAAAARMIARMNEGIDFGRRFDRAEIYDERMLQIDGRRSTGEE